MRVSPQERSQNGSATLTSATTSSQPALCRISATVLRPPTVTGTIAASVSAPSPSRPMISVAGWSSRTATLMKRKLAPQRSATVASKVESNNHPSAVEPFQGAATGIGGILRDIVAMGARPIALLDGLWFDAPGHPFQRAVAGIGAYGNSVGVANVGGATVFDEGYAGNCLVNAMCVGILDSALLQSAKASGPGNLVVLYGATTGRDGIGGAAVRAGQELGEDDADKRPPVQVGDPSTGKKLIEVSVELVESGLVESLQDCGAAGLASALSEMAGEGAGIDVQLDRVPLREDGMEPWEVMISESQERMVAIVRPHMLDAVRDVCARWELPCTPIGEVALHGELRSFWGGEIVGSVPARLLTDEW